MSQNKRASQPPQKSNPVLGIIALASIVAAVAVFLFTRPQTDGTQTVASTTVAQATQPSSAGQESDAAPAQSATPQQESQPAQKVEPQQQSQPAQKPVENSKPKTVTQPEAQKDQKPASEPIVVQKPVAPASPATPVASPAVPSPVSAQEQPNYRIPAHYENPEEAEPLAPTLDPATVADHARAAYQIALKKPRLLAQIPCFCYCDRFGHKSLHDCYAGRHAEECDVCLREAIEADKMDSEGMSAKEIRDAIIASHHPRS